MTIWLCYNSGSAWHGGYPQLMANAAGWQRVEPDLYYGDDISVAPGGKAMHRWRYEAQPGVVNIPATTQDNAVMSLVFSPPKAGNRKPVITSAPQTSSLNATQRRLSTAATDADGHRLIYSWHLTAKPAASRLQNPPFSESLQ